MKGFACDVANLDGELRKKSADRRHLRGGKSREE